MNSNKQLLADELNFFELVHLLKKQRVLLISVSSLFLILAIVYVTIVDDVYRAEIVLSPAERAGAENQQFSQFGQAANFVGISLDDENREIEYALELIRSRDFVTEFIERRNLAIPLMAGTWNARDTKSGIDTSIFDSETSEWGGQYSSTGPTDWQLYNKFIKTLEITESRQGSIVRLTIDWHDPERAADWLNALVDDLNANIKEKDRAEALRAIEYSQDQIDKTQLLEMQRIFYEIIEAQTRVVLLADVRDDYVFRVIDRAVPPEEKIAPQRAIIVLSSLVAGLFFGILTVLLKNVLNDGYQASRRDGV